MFKSRGVVGVSLPVLFAIACCALLAGTSARKGVVQIEMKNIDYHLDPETVLHIRNLRGALIATRFGVPVTFDDPRSFLLRVDGGEASITLDHLSAIMNRRVFGYKGAPFKDVRIDAEDGRLKLHLLLHKGVDIPVTMLADVGVASGGQIRLHAHSIKAEGIPVKNVMKVLGLELQQLVQLKRDTGITIEHDDFLVDAGRLVAEPQTRARVSAVRLEGKELIEDFGAGGITLKPQVATDSSYMYHRGGTVRFGKLTMNDTDLLILVSDFYLRHYNDELVAGYSKNTPSYGLIVHMMDYGRIAGTSH
jgi:hypothetical protein